MIKVVIFDIDGVLIDSLLRNLKLFRGVLRRAGYKKLPTRKEYQRIFPLTAVDSFKALTGNKDRKEIDKLMDMLRAYKHSEPLKIIPGSVSVIRKLSKKYKLALVTQRIKIGVDNYLDISKSRRYFKAVVHFGHFKHPRPHPEPLLIACRKLRVKPAEAVYVGDAPTDIQAAKAAKMKVILFPPKRVAGADGYAKTFAEIPKIISTMN